MSIKGIKVGKLRVMSDDQIKSIHQAAIRLIEKVGVKVENKEALKIYADNGCNVNFKNNIVKISEETLMEFLSYVPDKIALCGKKPEYDIELDCNSSFLMGGAAAVSVLDLEGVYRKPNIKDLYDFTRLQDALDNIHIICPMVIPQDVDPLISELVMSAETLKNTWKNCDLWVHSAEEVKYQVKIAEAILGSDTVFQQRPIFTNCICLISPLLQPDDVLETMIESVKLGVPVYIEVDDMLGATSPVTIAGTLVQQSANILPAIALAQMVKRGSPCIYSIASAATEMHSMRYSAADPVTLLLHVATAQIAHFYGIPFNGGTGLDSKLPDIQAGYERGIQNFACIAGGVNVVHLGAGMLEQMKLASFEQCIVDNEVQGMVKKFFEGFNIDQDTLAFEVIQNVFLMNKRSFLAEEHTLRYFKRNLWNFLITDKNDWNTWSTKGSKDCRQRAKEATNKILKEHYPEVISEKVSKDITEILTEARSKLLEKQPNKT